MKTKEITRTTIAVFLLGGILSAGCALDVGPNGVRVSVDSEALPVLVVAPTAPAYYDVTIDEPVQVTVTDYGWRYNHGIRIWAPVGQHTEWRQEQKTYRAYRSSDGRYRYTDRHGSSRTYNNKR